jgi:hypothetical protein
MHDEIDSRLWIENRKHFSDQLDRLFGGIGEVLARLYPLEWDAPWQNAGRGRTRPGQA